MLTLLEFIFGRLRNRLYDSFFQNRHNKRERLRRICKTASARIQRERPNFQKLVLGKTNYSSAAHKRAVEQYSFELLHTDIAPLQNLRRFKKSAAGLVANAETRNASAVLTAIDALEPKLVKFIGD